jgi:hypothetical protein
VPPQFPHNQIEQHAFVHGNQSPVSSTCSKIIYIGIFERVPRRKIISNPQPAYLRCLHLLKNQNVFERVLCIFERVLYF